VRRAILLGLLFFLSGCGTEPAAETWPVPDWDTARPAEVGLDSVMLSELDRDFAGGKFHFVDGMLVTRFGLLAYEATYRHDYGAAYAGRDTVSGMYNYYDPAWHPFHAGTPRHTMQSISKSVTSMVYGVAKERGEMPNIDSAVVDYFDRGDVAALDARKRRLTVRDLLTMRAGLDWDESSVAYTDPRNNCAVMEASPDWAAYAIGRPMAAEPGDTFVYNSGATVLLAHVFRRSTGQDLGEYAARHLFEPLGITDFYWKRTPTGLPDAEGGLYLLPRDLAKLGLLYLRGGRWGIGNSSRPTGSPRRPRRSRPAASTSTDSSGG
jgi:CubicO group peptidase (beta-lactamase class C family)